MKGDKTDMSAQEVFWKGDFGKEYISRNVSNELYSSNIYMFSRILSKIDRVNSILELGCNAGMNLKALKSIDEGFSLTGVDINHDAIEEVEKWGGAKTISSSILNLNFDGIFDLTFTKGVLIHINPDQIKTVYSNLYKYSSKYILIAEYYNPSPVSVEYRGHQERLFKRDFAGDMLDMFDDLELVDYGFSYHRDRVFPQDDITWFLLEKKY